MSKINSDARAVISSEQLFRYALAYFKRAQARGDNRLFPSFRQASKRFNATLDAVEDAIHDYAGPGYMGAIVGFKTFSGYGEIRNRGNYLVEVDDD